MKNRLGKIVVALLVPAALAVTVSCSGTPVITDDSGEKVPGSIASLESVEILGTQQWLTLRGHDDSAPVLLWLAGGPGGSELGWTRKYLSEMERDFVFANWEQPGTGKSYSAVDVREMAVEDYVDHVIAVSEYLTDRLGREKIVLVGHSWGSVIGLMAAERRPDLYHAYVGVGQHINALENDLLGYELVMKRAEAAGDTRIVRRLEKKGPPPYTGEEKGKYTFLFQKLFVYSPNPSSGGGIDSMAMFTPEEYTLKDKINLLRGLIGGVNYIYPQLTAHDFERDITRLEIPVFIVTGRYDYTFVQEIAYRWFKKLAAPHKRHYWFERSGHNSCYREADRFISLMRRDVLPLAVSSESPQSAMSPGQ